jgi:hypothetical protein
MKKQRSLVAAFLIVIAMAGSAAAEEAPAPEHDLTSLAKTSQNPVGNLLSFPFQFNFNNGGGYGDETMFLLNFQPVLPFAISSEWNVISRTIVPFYNFPGGSPADRITGVGDIQQAFYLTPGNPGKLIWGIGPVFSLPTATNDLVKTGSWAIGPGAVALTMAGPWVIGGLVNQYWNYSDHGGDPKTDLFVAQPFINYNFGKGWALSFAPLITANFDAADGQEWTIPLGMGITRTTRLNKRPLNLTAQYYANVERPDGAPGNQLRIAVILLYPK